MIRTKPTSKVDTAALNIAHGHTKVKPSFLSTPHKYLASGQFRFYSDSQTFAADASELGWPPGYFPGCITITSDRTGVMMSFLQLPDQIEPFDGEQRSVRYKSKTCEMWIEIFND